MHQPHGMQTPDWLEMVSHTADTGVVVRGAGMPDLYARAAWAMFHVIADLSGVRPEAATHLEVEAHDREALLVRWLSELNFLHQTEHLLFCRFDVSACSDQRLAAAVHGERIDKGRHRVYTEIKAVTFHNLRIVENRREWEAHVLFDV